MPDPVICLARDLVAIDSRSFVSKRRADKRSAIRLLADRVECWDRPCAA